MDKIGLLKAISFGQRIAEEEADLLATYFVETDQWTRLSRGDIDVIYGPKGAGKSALYSLLMAKSGELFDRGILLVGAENPRGATAFQELTTDPPVSEREFIGLWKLYIAALLHAALVPASFSNTSTSLSLASRSRVWRSPDCQSMYSSPEIPTTTNATLMTSTSNIRPDGFSGKDINPRALALNHRVLSPKYVCITEINSPAHPMMTITVQKYSHHSSDERRSPKESISARSAVSSIDELRQRALEIARLQLTAVIIIASLALLLP